MENYEPLEIVVEVCLNSSHLTMTRKVSVSKKRIVCSKAIPNIIEEM